MTPRAAWLAALGSMLAALLGGCAQLPFGGTEEPANAPAPAGPPPVRVEVQAPPDLRVLLLQHLDLARLQSAGQAEALSPTELDRLIGATPAQAQALLETEGYFDARVRAHRVDDGGAPPLVRVEVEPGTPTLIERVTFEVQGEVERLAEAGDAKARELLQTLREDWPLAPGKGFRESAWVGAKDGVLATLRSHGYLSASWSGTAVEIDPDRASARVFVVADSGALFRSGAIKINGLQRQDEGAVLPLARELTGRPATERTLRETQERILALGMFESVIIDVDGTAADPTAAPVTVAVRETPLQLLTLGVGVSGDTGAQLTLEYTHRRPFDLRWTAVNKLQFGPELNSWQSDLLSHPLEDGYRQLLAGKIEDLVSDDETRLSWHLRAGRTRDSERVWRLIYGEYAWARLDTSAGVNVSSALSANYHWNWRDVDDLRTPTKGTVWSLQGGGGWTQGSVTSATTQDKTEAAGPFARLYGRVTGFWKLGNNWWGGARLELGEVFVRDALSVPDTLLFRAGGDDSVRGYAYRTLGPQVNGATVSGTTLFTTSVQVEHPIFDQHPAFLWALFVDAGNASDGWSNMRPVLGYGVGVHWRSPVGPLRLDLAYGQELHKLRLHFSVGIVF